MIQVIPSTYSARQIDRTMHGAGHPQHLQSHDRLRGWWRAYREAHAQGRQLIPQVQGQA